jgi:hypothetical protein
MKLELLRTEETDGKWFKIIGAGGWPLKVIGFNDENELQKRNEILTAFDEIQERATKLNIVVLKSVEI